jgi:hypothetical protein
MTKKTDGSDTITKDYLDNRLNDFEGKMNGRFDDFEGKMNGRFDDFEGKMNGRFDEFEGIMNGRFDEFEGRIERKVDETISKSMNQLYTRIDPLLSEIENNRIDRVLTTDQLQTLKRRADNHERRIKKLENN